MKIHFDEIPENGLKLDIQEEAWLPSNALLLSGKPSCAVTLALKEGRVLMHGVLSLDAVVDCDRCLASKQVHIDNCFDVFFEHAPEGDPHMVCKEYACESSDLDVIYVAEPEIDIFSVLEQQVMLALPVKNLCRKECRGLCYSCGKNLNDGVCNCSREETVSPFGALAKLKHS